MGASRLLKWSSERSGSGGSVACTYPFFDLSCRPDHNLTVARNLVLRKSGQEPGETDGAYELLVRSEDRSGDSGNIRVPLAQTDINPMLSNLAGRCAFTPAESLQDLTGRAEAEWDHIALLDLVPRQPVRVDPVKAHTDGAARYVKRRALAGLTHEIEKDGSYNDAEIQALPKHRPKTPQHGTKVIEAVFVPHKIPEAFQRYGKSQNRGFGKPASICQIPEWKGGWAVMKYVQQGEGALDRFDPGETVIRASLGAGGAVPAFSFRHDSLSRPGRSSRAQAGSTPARHPIPTATRDTHTISSPDNASDQNLGGGPNSFLFGGA